MRRVPTHLDLSLSGLQGRPNPEPEIGVGTSTVLVPTGQPSFVQRSVVGDKSDRTLKPSEGELKRSYLGSGDRLSATSKGRGEAPPTLPSPRGRHQSYRSRAHTTATRIAAKLPP